MVEGDLTWGGEHTVQYADGVLQKCTPKTYILLLTTVTLINSIKQNKIKKIIYTLVLPITTYECKSWTVKRADAK